MKPGDKLWTKQDDEALRRADRQVKRRHAFIVGDGTPADRRELLCGAGGVEVRIPGHHCAEALSRFTSVLGDKR